MKQIILCVLMAWLTITAHAQWSNGTSDNEGRVNCFATAGSTIIAGTEWGAYFSKDNGATWTEVSDLSFTPITSIVVNGSKMFASSWFGRVYISSNQGMNWTEVNNGLPNAAIESLTISGSYLFAGTTGDSVYYTTNSGGKWNFPANRGFSIDAISIKAMATIGTKVFAGTWDSLYVTTDNGTNWKPIAEGFINCLKVDGANIWAGAKNDGVLLSIDSGKSFKNVSTGLTDLDPLGFAVNGTNTYAATWSGLFRTSDKGVKWNLIAGLDSLHVTAVMTLGSTVFAGMSDGSIWYTQNPSGIHQPTKPETNIRIFPNPSDELLTIASTGNITAVSISDLTGKAIYVNTCSAGNTTTQIDVSVLPKGLYFISVHAGEEIYIEKLVIN